MKQQKTLPATAANVRRVARHLRAGGIAAFPTETVYGLGALFSDERAVCRVFEVKRRPSFDPLIVHVASLAQARALWKEVPPAAEKLMKKFWPGPLSIVLPKAGGVPDVVTSGLDTVAVRMPDHPAALALIRISGPLAAPSANYFGYTSPTEAAPVAEDFGKKVPFVLDGGPSRVGVESTVVKVEAGRVVLLRPGGVTVEEMERVLGSRVRTAAKTGKMESPGRLKSHYAPSAPLVLMEGPAALFVKKLRAWSLRRARRPRLALIVFSGNGFEACYDLFAVRAALSPKGDFYEAASLLFQVMRKIDKMKPDAILAEPFPEKGLGRAIADRLRKASGGKKGWRSFTHIFRER